MGLVEPEKECQQQRGHVLFPLKIQISSLPSYYRLNRGRKAGLHRALVQQSLLGRGKCWLIHQFVQCLGRCHLLCLSKQVHLCEYQKLYGKPRRLEPVHLQYRLKHRIDLKSLLLKLYVLKGSGRYLSHFHLLRHDEAVVRCRVEPRLHEVSENPVYLLKYHHIGRPNELLQSWHDVRRSMYHLHRSGLAIYHMRL
ncbi:Uncharacterised protein [Acinetobacter baumannii]|nr:Uncharacterised protein [Acinetobacter baumannii]